MRTVFIPSIVLDASQEERHKIGDEERTVVLCVEIENSGESGQGFGFEVQNVDVVISGDEAKATLITWGQESFTSQENVFPLRIAHCVQYNLLYAVTFLRSPEELDAFSFFRSTTQVDLQRAVSIIIHGRPYVKSSTVLYPTRAFSSKWNCVLDLNPNQPQNFQNLGPTDLPTTYPSVLPEPPSPFPVFGLQGSKRSPGLNVPFSTRMTSEATKGGQLMAGGMMRASAPQVSVGATSQKTGLPALAIPSLNARSPTTYSAPPPPPPPDTHKHHSQSLPSTRTHTPIFENPPVTPAYPAYPSSKLAVPSAPISHAPVVSQSIGGVVGPTLEARRGRESGEVPAASQQHRLDGQILSEQKMMMEADGRDTVVISVGLLNVSRKGGADMSGKRKGWSSEDKKVSRDDDDNQDEEDQRRGGNEEVEVDDERSNQGYHRRRELGLGPVGKIYPLDSFTLDIFVFNKSDRTRRFEISYFEWRRKRKGVGHIGPGLDQGGVGTVNKMGYPGIVPLEGQVRIG